MPLTLKLSRKWTDRYALIVLSGLLPVVLGMFILFWQANRSLELEAELNNITGVVSNGLFARRGADVLLLAGAAGVRTIRRK